jgi:hypothetical protein
MIGEIRCRVCPQELPVQLERDRNVHSAAAKKPGTVERL